MKMREALIAALRRDPGLIPNLLRERIDQSNGRMATVIQVAEAVEPVLAEAVGKTPSKLGKLGLKTSHLLASLAEEDENSNRVLAKIAKGSTVGIVFVDVAGFTTYTERNGDAAAIELLNRLHEIVEARTKATKGECVKHLGDGYLLAFPSASQAVRAATGLSDAVRKERVKDRSFDARLRVAVHAGEPLVEGDDLLGHDVNLAARLLDHCRPDEVVVSEAAKELAQKRLRTVDFRNEREVKIRGLMSPVTLFTAVTAPASSPPGTPAKKDAVPPTKS